MSLTVSSGYHLPYSGHSIPIDMARGGSRFYGRTIRCIYDGIGELLWIIF